MARVGRLKQGTLDIAGSLNERLPAVTKGLVAHYPFDGTLNNFNIAADIGVFSGTIADKTTPSSILGTYNVTASNGGIAFAGTVDSWVKLDSTPFGSLNDFRTEIGFILNAFQVAGGLSTIFHLANSGGNAFFIAVADNGSVEVHYNGQGYRFEAANTIVLGKYYDFVVKKVGSLLEVLINGVPMFSKTVTPVTLAITSGVLGQEQDVDYGGFQANQAFNGTLFYLKFFKLGVATGANYTLDANGVSTETATTNLHPSPLDLTAAPWRTFPDAIESKGIIREFYDNNKIVRITRPDLASSCTEILSDNTMPISVSTIYTQSLDVRTDGTIKTITFYTNNGHHTVAPSVVDLEQGWKRLTASYTSQSTDTFLRICDIYVNNDWTFIEMKRPQIEQRPYASAFTAVSRGDGNVDITIPTINSTSQSFTVNFNVAFNGVNPASRDTCLELNNFLLLWLFAPTSTDTYNRRLIMDFKTLDGGGTGVPGYTGSARVSKDLQDTNPFVPWKYETITLTWDGSTIRAYRNGILWGGRGKDSTCVLGTIDKLMFRKFGQIKNLSVHNRVLTDADIYKLSNYKFGVSKFGDIHVVSSERPNSIPSGCYYFPLGLNAKNEFNNIGPYAEVNTVYEDGSVWVGSATTNLLDGTMSINNNFSIVIEDGWNKLTLNSGDGSMGNRFFVPVSSLTNGAIYTASCEVYNPNAEAITAHIDWCDQNNINTLIPPFTLKRIYVTASRSAYDATYRFMDVAITDVGKTIWIRKPMVQRTSFLTPYTPLSKDTSQLTFNLNSKIGLDWSGDWSIVYFKKPVGTSIDLTGYSLESLGCNTNSVGGSYLWWGKGGSTNTLKGNSEGGVPIPTFDNNVINPSTFFNNWYMVSVVKSGTTITIKYFGVDKSVRTATLSGVSYTAANAFVNQYGYDFNLGGWDNNTNGYVSNAYYRDLIVAKRALSAAEVEAIFKTFMKAKQTGLQIQGRLKENVVL